MDIPLSLHLVYIAEFGVALKWQPTPVFLPGGPHGWRSLVGYSSWGRKESDMTEQLSPHLVFLENLKRFGDFLTLVMYPSL